MEKGSIEGGEGKKGTEVRKNKSDICSGRRGRGHPRGEGAIALKKKKGEYDGKK